MPYVSLRAIGRALGCSHKTAKRIADAGRIGSRLLPGTKHPRYLLADAERIATESITRPAPATAA